MQRTQKRLSKRESNFLVTIPLEANGNSFEIVKSVKILGVTVRNDLKWNDHVDNITAKASRRIYLLKQLKRAGIDRKALIQFHCACIRSILESVINWATLVNSMQEKMFVEERSVFVLN